MANATYQVSVSAAGLSVEGQIVRSGDGVIGHEIALPAADAGTLSTRTDDDTGTLTMSSGSHGITTGAVIDLYWSGGVRYGITVGTVSGTSVPIGADDSGAGDVLPAQDTAITADVQVSVNTLIDGDNVSLLAMELQTTGTSGKGHVDMLDSGPATIEEIDLVGNVPRVFDITGGDTNVFTGNVIESMKVSNGDTTAATLIICGVQDSTP